MIIDKYNRMKKIWAGTRFGTFVRRSLGKGRREFFMELKGYRKAVLLGDYTNNTKTVEFGIVPINKINDKDQIDLSGGVESDQGRHGSCACTTLATICQDWAIADTRDKTLETDWLTAWNKMISIGLADDKKGSYLEDNIWYAQEIGYEDNKGNTWKIDVVEKIEKQDCEKYIRMGYQVYTGSYCGYPFCDKNWFFNVGKRDFGHSFRKIGLTLWQKAKVCLNETTWKNYGLKRESQFFSIFGDDRKLMSCYVFTFKKV